ncbi:MAG TPA: hypothetical protein VIX90_16795, partial [Edaphobacter sp.]
KFKILQLRKGVLFLALFVLLFAASVARAQVAAYGGFSGGPIGGTGISAAYGAVVGVYAQSGHFVSLGGDARGTFLSHNGFHYYTGAVGPRLAIKPPILPFRPYVEGLVGVADFNNGSGTSSSTKFNYQALGGVDFTFFPHLDWRVIEFAYSGSSGSSVNAKIFTTGLVVRLW